MPVQSRYALSRRLMLSIVVAFGIVNNPARGARQGRTAQARGAWTWGVFSSGEKSRAEAVSLSYRDVGLPAGVTTGLRDGEIVFRVAVGNYGNREDAYAARKEFGDIIPSGAWLVHLNVPDVLTPAAHFTPGLLSRPNRADPTPPAADRTRAIATDTLLVPASAGLETESTAPRTSRFRSISATALLTNSFDTNIDHNADNLDSYGVIPGARIQFRQAARHHWFHLMYAVGVHSYTQTNRWDRVSHQFRAGFEGLLTGPLRSETAADVSIGGSSEDRDISNQFQASQAFEIRFDRYHRLQTYATIRFKRFPDAPQNNAFKPNIGFEYEQRYRNGQRWGFGGRYEIKRVANPRSNYYRWTFDIEYRTPMVLRANQLILQAKNKRKFYWTRRIRVVDKRVLRRDRRWTLGLEWRHTVSRGVKMSLGYQYEVRTSNDDRKFYRAHFVVLAASYKLWH